MENDTHWLEGIRQIYREGRKVDDPRRCTVAPSPELKEQIKTEIARLRGTESALAPLVRAAEPRRPGLNDGLIIPPEEFPEGTPISVIRSAAAERAPLRGVVRVVVVLAEFSDLRMTRTAAEFERLFFSTGVLPTKSVREYFQEVTNNLIDIQGQVVGPYQLPQTLAAYAHGASGIGGAVPNAQTMARDALLAADPQVDFTPYDNDGNGFVDAFIVIHAGRGAEETGRPGDIWSHKWVLDGGARPVDATKVYAYLTVPEDAKIGVCCHELGHLLFGFPDLYDTDNSSEGVGDWCLMGSGSWGGRGDTPVHPSAWCKAQQGWVTVDARTGGSTLSIPDVKTSRTVYRLSKDGVPGSEYFLLENRQQTGFDVSLPGGGILVWHIDESVGGNTNELHYKVALMQADGRRDLESDANRGDPGDPFPGTSNNTSFTHTTNPSSKAYAGTSTCVSITGIGSSGPVMSANVQVHCRVAWWKGPVAGKEPLKEYLRERKERLIDAKPIRDMLLVEAQAGGTASGVATGGGGTGGGVPGAGGRRGRLQHLETRVADLEAMLAQVLGDGGTSGGETRGEPTEAARPFIGEELRPDLSQGALLAEDDRARLREEMQHGSAPAKRQYDKSPEA